MTVLQNKYLPVESTLSFSHFSTESVSPVVVNEKPALLLIHGWANSSLIWDKIIPELEKNFCVYSFDLPGHGNNAEVHCETIEEFYALYHHSIHVHLPSNYMILGWSLGGALGSLLAKKYNHSVSALITIATNPVFVSREDWLQAMPASVVNDFYTGLTDKSDKFVNRFWLLQSQGVNTLKNDLRWLKTKMAGVSHSKSGLRAGLNWLKSIDLRSCWECLTIPVFHHYGVQDAIVPISVAKKIESIFPQHKVFRYHASSHMPFVSEQDKWLEYFYASMRENGLLNIDGFVISSNGKDCNTSLDKHLVAKAFSRAAIRYDELANFQNIVGKELLSKLPAINGHYHTNVLDLGSGTGFMARHIAEGEGEVNTVEIDIAMGMLQRSQIVCAENNESVRSYIQADMENLPVTDNHFDLVLSNLSLQWCEDLQAAFSEVYRVLQVEGFFGFTTVLPGSLLEIQQAWSSLDGHQHINSFYNESEIRKRIRALNLQSITWEVTRHKDYFPSIEALLHSVRGIGAGNHLAGRPKGLMGKKRYREFLSALALRCEDSGRYALSYNILTAVLKKPALLKVKKIVD